MSESKQYFESLCLDQETLDIRVASANQLNTLTKESNHFYDTIEVSLVFIIFLIISFFIL